MNDSPSQRIRLGLLAAMLALSACVSDALPREDDHAPPGDARAESDAKDGATDSARGDAPDSAAPDDVDVSSDSRDANDERTGDATIDISIVDATGASDAGDAGAADVSDVSTTTDVSDARADVNGNDADAGPDVNDAGAPLDTADAKDAGAPPDADVNDSSVPIDATSNDASDAGAPGDAAADGATDGGVVVFYLENFDTALGGFSAGTTVCGTTVPQWSNNAGYAHASEPAVTGVSRISSPVITVPSNVSNVILSIGHKFDIEDTYDCAQLLVSINGATATVVTTFTAGGYTTGGDTNPATCATGNPRQFPGWSGLQSEEVSTVNLSTLFGIDTGDTVAITFRMAADYTQGKNGWDINWVTLSANSP